MTRQPKWPKWCGVLIAVIALVASACATGGGGSRSAKDEMEAGYKAARRGYWQEALVRFEAANTREPNQPRILNNLAVALEAVGRYDEARTTYERAMEIARGDRHLSRNYKFFEEFYQSFVLREEPDEESRAQAQEDDDDDE